MASSCLPPLSLLLLLLLTLVVLPGTTVAKPLCVNNSDTEPLHTHGHLRGPLQLVDAQLLGSVLGRGDGNLAPEYVDHIKGLAAHENFAFDVAKTDETRLLPDSWPSTPSAAVGRRASRPRRASGLGVNPISGFTGYLDERDFAALLILPERDRHLDLAEETVWTHARFGEDIGISNLGTGRGMLRGQAMKFRPKISQNKLSVNEMPRDNYKHWSNDSEFTASPTQSP